MYNDTLNADMLTTPQPGPTTEPPPVATGISPAVQSGVRFVTFLAAAVRHVVTDATSPEGGAIWGQWFTAVVRAARSAPAEKLAEAVARATLTAITGAAATFADTLDPTPTPGGN